MVQTLRHSIYAILFTIDDSEDDGSTIILARSMTQEELNEEKERTVRAVQGKTDDTKQAIQMTNVELQICTCDIT